MIGGGLLRRAPALRLLFLATVTSSIGTWLAVVALVIDVFDRTGDARWVSALLIAEFLPILAIALFAAPLVDRLPRRSILIASDLVRAAVFCLLPFAGGALQIVLLALVAGAATSLFRPAVYAGVPNLVSDDELPRANGLLQAAENLTVALGPLAGGILVALTGPDPAYWFNAATFVLSALLIFRIRQSLEEERKAREGHWRQVVEGFALIRHSPALLTVLIAWGIVMLGNAGINVAEVVLAKDVFDAGDFGYGLLLATAGLGLVTGSVVATSWIERRGVKSMYPAAIAVMGAGFGAAAVSPTVWIAAAFVLLAGLGNGSAVVCNAVLVQRGAPDQARGRAFTVLMGSGYAALGLGMVLAGPLTNAWGARIVWGTAAALYAAGALAAVVLLRGSTDTRVVPAEPPALAPVGDALPLHEPHGGR